MRSSSHHSGLFPALLKHWRGQRGLSQIDLALAADVSTRHVSFLETGRSMPSTEMVLRLATALDVPLRHVNEMLQAAGFEPYFPKIGEPKSVSEEVDAAIQLMKDHHDPFPLVVLDRCYNVVDLNVGAMALFKAIIPNQADQGEVNLARTTFDPEGAKPALVNFDEVGRTLLWRIQREVFADPNDTSLRQLLDQILANGSINDDWREVDLSIPPSPAIVVHLRAGEKNFRFLTTVTAFQAPQSVWLDELRIETWFPCDPETTAACRQMVDAVDPEK